MLHFVEKNWKEISPGAFFIKIKDQYGSDESLNEQAGLDFIDPEAEYCEVLEDDDLSSVSDDKSYMNSPEPDDTTGTIFHLFTILNIPYSSITVPKL